MKITFFGTQPYDRESFDRANERYGFEFNYHRSHLNGKIGRASCRERV